MIFESRTASNDFLHCFNILKVINTLIPLKDFMFFINLHILATSKNMLSKNSFNFFGIKQGHSFFYVFIKWLGIHMSWHSTFGKYFFSFEVEFLCDKKINTASKSTKTKLLLYLHIIIKYHVTVCQNLVAIIRKTSMETLDFVSSDNKSSSSSFKSIDTGNFLRNSKYMLLVETHDRKVYLHFFVLNYLNIISKSCKYQQIRPFMISLRGIA